MFNVCPRCGIYAANKEIDPAGPYAVCPHCGHRQPFLQMPLFIVTGASGSGKSTVTLELAPALRGQVVVIESDTLWCAEFATPEDDFRRFRELCLRVAKNVSQSGLPVVLTGSFNPLGIDDLIERRYFGDIYVLALVADDEVLAQRLRERPAWRESGSEEFIEGMIEFNQRLKRMAESLAPSMKLIDTGCHSVEEAVDTIAAWVLSQM
jgi:ribose 1,5-bisphosphokinase PhnN